eukprot:231176-Rhodomonas_salina.2
MAPISRCEKRAKRGALPRCRSTRTCRTRPTPKTIGSGRTRSASSSRKARRSSASPRSVSFTIKGQSRGLRGSWVQRWECKSRDFACLISQFATFGAGLSACRALIAAGRAWQAHCCQSIRASKGALKVPPEPY